MDTVPSTIPQPLPPIGLEPAEEGPSTQARRKLILIVDDNVVFLKAISMKLSSFGYDVITAVDGSAAVGAVREAKPDLILLDLNFPPDVAHGGGLAWDGFLILNWLRRIDEAHGVPIIAITGGEIEKYRERCKEAGILDILAKPLDPEVLQKVIKTTLSQRESEEEPTPAPARSLRLERKLRILFVDDESEWRQMALGCLADHGYEVVTTETAAGALQKAATTRPDLIVVDLKLAEESGLRAMRLLVAAHPALPILVYTGMGVDKATKDELINQGACQCLCRRSMEELLTAVEMAIERRRHDLDRPAEVPKKGSPDASLDFESVLIVEHDPAFSETLRAFLESHSLSVTHVSDVIEGLRQLTAVNFDLILTEMALPGASGEDFYREVQRIKPNLCRRFVFMTGHDADPRTDRFIRRVRAIMLWKPFPLGDVLIAARTIRRREALVAQPLRDS